MDTRGLIQWLHEKWGDDHPCPHCHGQEWSVADELAQVLPAHDIERPDGGSRGHGCYVVTCDGCGYIVLLSAARVHGVRA